jgi:hypothetical protein
MSDRASGAIFISYRREDTAYPAGWLFDRLADTYGEELIFKDIDSIALGDDFVDVITRAVASTDVLLALIGEKWIAITDEDGRRRLDDPDDFVRLEIEAALTRGIRVIPILVGGTTMPRSDQLPPGLTALARRNALELSPSRFESDTSRLIKVLDQTLADVLEETLTGELKADRVADLGQRSRAGVSREPAQPRSEMKPSSIESSGPSTGSRAPSAGRTRALRSLGKGWHERTARHWQLLAGIAVAIIFVLVAIVLVVTRSHPPPDAAPVQGGASAGASTFTDDFSSKGYGWENVGRSELGGRYRDGSYYLTGAKEDAGDGFNTVVAAPKNQSTSDGVRIKVDARMTGGGTAIFGRAYGIFCRGQGSETLYAFSVWKNGAEIGKNSSGLYERLSKVDQSVTSQAGEQFKRLEAVCRTTSQGNRDSVELEFWVDEKKILTATDPSDEGVGNPLLDGRYGLQLTFGSTGDAGETFEAEFDNFEISGL